MSAMFPGPPPSAAAGRAPVTVARGLLPVLTAVGMILGAYLPWAQVDGTPFDGERTVVCLAGALTASVIFVAGLRRTAPWWPAVVAAALVGTVVAGHRLFVLPIALIDRGVVVSAAASVVLLTLAIVFLLARPARFTETPQREQ